MRNQICDSFLITLQKIIEECHKNDIDLTESDELHDKFSEFTEFLDETGTKPKWEDYPEVNEQYFIWKEHRDDAQDISWMFDD